MIPNTVGGGHGGAKCASNGSIYHLPRTDYWTRDGRLHVTTSVLDRWGGRPMFQPWLDHSRVLFKMAQAKSMVVVVVATAAAGKSSEKNVAAVG